jgi:glycosyltransferase 2 family protein
MVQRLVFVGKAVLSITLVYWIIARANLSEVFDSLGSAKLSWLVLAGSMPAIGILLTVVRWGTLLRAQNARIPTTTLYQSYMVASFFGQFLPSTIGGDAVRAYDSWKLGASKSAAFSAILVDRFVGLTVLVCLGMVAVCFPSDLTRHIPAIYSIVVIAAIGILLCLWLFFAPSKQLVLVAEKTSRWLPDRVRSILGSIFEALTIYRRHAGALSQSLFLSILLQLNVVTFYFFIGRSIGIEISYGFYYLIVPIAVLVMLAPISLNGIGVREGVFVFLLGKFAIDDAHAVAFAWIEYGIVVFYGMLGGLVYAFRKAPVQELPSTDVCPTSTSG